ncbi:MAG TPA: haloacid dehalogenase-like hydrolase [Candidatus Mcinerneyibacteriales bacterium]|nr:haloacid dehalogenase-like hydrolase [Candidatus Mcinerneyibacteriales bacterium]
MKPLIFFDINGTLITRDARTDLPFSRAVDRFLGSEDGMAGVDTSARSDKDVFMEVLTNHKKQFTERRWDSFLSLYEEELKSFASSDIWRPNADAFPFVKSLSEKGYPLALITGELSVGAEYKLRRIGLWEDFIAGGFGEDALRRFEIAEAARDKIEQRLGTLPDTLYVIGDTVLDIRTARHLNARAVAITTGSHSREKLLNENPDYCIDSFKEILSLFV